MLRLNNERVFKKDGTPRPKDYILERLKAVEGRTVEEAVGTLQKDTKGRLKPYRAMDLNYDIECGWIRVELVGGGEGEGHATTGGRVHTMRAGGNKAETRPGMRHKKAAAAHIKARRGGKRARHHIHRKRISRATWREARSFMAALHTQGLVRSDIGRLNAVANTKAYMAMRDVKW